ncbi:MAG: RagB/SusD family nutrient uptake outer membrane protein [Bacteroidales bacterium]|nr:RagB/SusD family nutrient uptake outer membrane protein [Bacteroidales bacterium]
MKLNKYILAAGAFSLLATSCDDVLEETPRGIYTPEYFKTEKGVMGGLTSQYTHLRGIYSTYFYAWLECGTDEYTYAQSADNNFKDVDFTGVGQYNSTSSRSDNLWGSAFTNINTASGIIENGEVAKLDPALFAVVRFFRVFDYFQLVQIFGGVPLDLGAGELKFNTSKSRTSVRNTVPEVYAAIFSDLEKAVKDLPEKARMKGTVTKTVARLYLAKAYLTFAWWLENPKNIATYPACDRKAKDGKSAAQYFQMAYDMAMEGINNPGEYGLNETFYETHVGSTDRNKERLPSADHTESDEFYDGQNHGYASGGAYDQIFVWFATSNYCNIKTADGAAIGREAAQEYGRPWTRMAPPVDVFTKTFADQTNDSRFDGTFVGVYHANWHRNGDASLTHKGANDMDIQQDGAVLSFIPQVEGIDYSKNGGSVGAGVLPGRADYVIGYEDINRILYPGLWKLGTYRTDNNGGMGSPNGGITRPTLLAKFSELYLVAAEAAVKGATGAKSARDLVNVLRARAGKWVYSNAEHAVKEEDHSAEMVAATPATIDMEYIMAERSRELFGEGHRRLDLLRTQMYVELAGTYRISGSGYNDHTAETFTRDFKDYNWLAPIPQGQLDAMEMTPDEKKAYQNPGY